MVRNLVVSATQPGAYPTIGDALEVAEDGAVIMIAPGEYRMVIPLGARRLTLAAGAATGPVTIDGSGASEPVVSVQGGTVTLRGLTLRGGYAHAVQAAAGRLTVERCVIEAGYAAGVLVSDGTTLTATDTTVTGGQYGLVIEDSGGLVDKCEIRGSVEDGVIVRLGADPTIRNTTVIGAGFRGVYIYQAARPTLERCDISGIGDVGISVAQQSSPTIRNSWVHDTQGAGLAFGRGCGGLVEECRVENTGIPGIFVEDGANPTIRAATPGLTALPNVGIRAVEGSTSQDPEKVEQLLGELDAMVGLNGVKAEVRSLIDEIQVNEWRRNAGLAVGAASHHLIFTGAPGTGKTTVARIYGQLLKALGILPVGLFKEVTRRDMVGQYIGHTAEKTNKVFEEAMGGVLFIDEAYTLSRASGAAADFGQEAIDSMVKLMEDHRDTIAVIVAGYTKEMVDFLDANSGLASRFAKTLEFQNYSPDELVLIVERIASTDDYLLEPGLADALLEWFAAADRDENFGNAREARRLLEGMRKAQSGRLRQLGHVPDRNDLRTLVLSDLLATTR
jgi:hypothetical protein